MDRTELENMMSGLVEKVKDDRRFMAHVLARYLMIEGFDQATLEGKLGLSADLYFRLAMCKRPEKDSPGFAQAVESISDYTMVDVIELSHIIRQVDSFESITGCLAGADETQFSGISLPALAAARDRINSEETENDDPEETESRPD